MPKKQADPYAAIAEPEQDPYAAIAENTGYRELHRDTNADLDHGILTNLGIGALRGAGNTVAGVGELLNAIPGVGETLAPRQGLDALHHLSTPQGTGQKVGYYGEQTAEWLAPVGVEGKAAQLTGKVLANSPKIARVAVPAAKAVAAGLEAGVRNKVQGGSFKGGAAVGAAGPILAPVAKKAASGLANIAMSPGKRLLKSIPEDVNIGKTVMEEATGVRPSTITRQLQDKVTAKSGQLDTLLSNASKQNPLDPLSGKGAEIPLTPARQEISSELASAVKKNSPEYIKDVRKLEEQMKYQHGPDGKPVMQASTPATRQGAGFSPVQVAAPQTMTPTPLPAVVDPVRARQIKQGVDLTIGNWNPESQAAIAPLQERVRGSIAGEIHNAVPGSGQLDKDMTSLIPSAEAAWNVSFNPEIAKSVFNRFGRPTGALVGAGLGANEGYKEGGGIGAVIGGAAGLVAPELIASPTGQMIMARTIASPRTFNIAKGLGVQLDRPGALDTAKDNAGAAYDKAATRVKQIFARDEQGQLHSAPVGAPLPQGWTIQDPYLTDESYPPE